MLPKTTQQVKNTELLIRLSKKQKQQLTQYAKKHNLKVSVAIRLILEGAIEMDENGADAND